MNLKPYVWLWKVTLSELAVEITTNWLLSLIWNRNIVLVTLMDILFRLILQTQEQKPPHHIEQWLKNVARELIFVANMEQMLIKPILSLRKITKFVGYISDFFQPLILRGKLLYYLVVISIILKEASLIKQTCFKSHNKLH